MQINTATLSEFNKGYEMAFKVVFDDFYKPLLYFVTKLVSDRQEAEDITLETFQKLFARHQDFTSGATIRSFLFTTARNHCLNVIKATRIHQHHLRNQPQSEIDTAEAEAAERQLEAQLISYLHNAIEKLPSRCREVFRLLFIEQLKPVDVAQRLNINVDNVYSQKKRAVELLRTAVNEHPEVMVLAGYLFSVFLSEIYYVLLHNMD